MISAALTRPRYWSGVATWMIVERSTTLTTSAIPATIRHAIVVARSCARPKPASAAPQTATEISMPKPGTPHPAQRAGQHRSDDAADREARR